MDRTASTIGTTVDDAEVARFDAQADLWWDTEGPFALLHRYNPVRIAWVRERICRRFDRDPVARAPFEGLAMLDVGCGGGLIAEPLARLGASVTGIDAAPRNVGTAAAHAARTGLAIDYRHTTIEALAEAGETFDVVLALEIIEHVADQPSFVAACARVLKPGGLVFLSTINRTAKAFALTIVDAEWVLRWIPRGTHDWQKYVMPHELARMGEAAGLRNLENTGVRYDVLSREWALTPDLSVNYMMLAARPDA